MGLSGSQQAYMLAVADVARADGTRAGYFLRNVIPVWINGAARQGLVLESLDIGLRTGGEPFTASFDFKGGSGFVPKVGQSVVIGHGTTDNALFSGRILKCARRAARADERRPLYEIEAVGHLFDLGTTRVQNGLSMSSMSPRSIVRAVLAATTPSASGLGFTTDYVSADLGTIAAFDISPHDDVVGKLSELFDDAGATFYVDHAKRVRAFSGSNYGPGVLPSTLTTASTFDYWNVRVSLTDLSRIFTRIDVLGHEERTLAGVEPAAHKWAPVSGASLLCNTETVIGDEEGTMEIGSSELILFDHTPMTFGARVPEKLFPTRFASVFLPATIGSNTLTIVAQNFNCLTPIYGERWYAMGGQYIYVSSQIGLYSLTANSIAYNYWVRSTGSGAINSDISALTDIAGVWNVSIGSVTLPQAFYEAGTSVRVYARRTDPSAINQMSSLAGTTAFGVIPQTLNEGQLGPTAAGAVADAALARGAPDQWAGLEFDTRARHFDVGRPVYVAVTSTAEPSGSALSGEFVAHEITIADFGTLTDTRGPVRQVTAGAVKRPTLWQREIDRVHTMRTRQ